ncbi:hypothetical protein Zmor_002709 [Zophobas morio]|uniref:NADH dehydrogenase [ubiquinone] 1 alpha subcomplex subunit 1 n=1 Tax=Zophobas morio TaxID=2755281 RepID=A0AA38HL85_9CUCU|nr:hypothetical protein Zmor_002709 [Zophobas morio]
MWYEIIPSFGIIVVAMAVPHAVSYVANKLVVGNFYRRAMLDKEEALQYLRDTRIAGDPYTLKGLENIPDQ